MIFALTSPGFRLHENQGIIVLFFIVAFIVFMYLLIEWAGKQVALPPKSKTMSVTISRPRIVDYLIDPDSRLSHIFVMPDALNGDQVTGYMPFTDDAQGISNIKLVRSGTGFRVYNHPTVKEGQWLPCR